MPILYGDWFAGGEARIVCEYSQNYNADHTSVHFNASYRYQMAYSVNDSTNSWGVSGDNGSATGNNVGYIGPGTKEFYFQYGPWRQSNAAVSAWVDGVEAQGVRVFANFVFETGALAPYITGFQASTIKANSFIADLTAVTANGGTLNNAQVKLNTVKSDTGASYITRGSYGDVTVPNLLGGQVYYFQMRVSNSTYGWGPWTAWATVTTLPDILINVGGVWKHATPYVNVGGVWKQADRWVNVGGVWKK